MSEWVFYNVEVGVNVLIESSQCGHRSLRRVLKADGYEFRIHRPDPTDKTYVLRLIKKPVSIRPIAFPGSY